MRYRNCSHLSLSGILDSFLLKVHTLKIAPQSWFDIIAKIEIHQNCVVVAVSLKQFQMCSYLERNTK